MVQTTLDELTTIAPGRHVLTFDLPGHEEPMTGGSYRMDPWVEAIRAAVEEAVCSAPQLPRPELWSRFSASRSRPASPAQTWQS
jgi:hypothetical protein